MSESPLIAREEEILETLEQLSNERARSELDVERNFQTRTRDEERAHAAHRDRVTSTARADTQAIKAKYQAVRDEATRKADEETRRVEAEYEQVKKAFASKARSTLAAAKTKKEETRWQALAIYEAGKEAAVNQSKQHEAAISALAGRLDDFKVLAQPVLARCRRFVPRDAAVSQPAVDPPPNPIDGLEKVLELAEERIRPLGKLFLPKLLDWQTYPFPFILLAIGIAYPLGTSLGWNVGPGLAVGIAIAAAIAARIGLARLARAKLARVYPPFAAAVAEAEGLVEASRTWAKGEFTATKAAVEERRESEARKASEAYTKSAAEAEARRDQAAREADATYPTRLRVIAEERENALQQADEFYPRRLAEIQERFQREIRKLQEEFEAKKEKTGREYAAAWDALENRWREGLARVGRISGDVSETRSRQFLDWHEADLDAWQPPLSAPDGLQFGTFTIDLADIPQGTPTADRLKAHGPTRHELPALLPFSRQGSVLIKAADAGKGEAVKLLQALMLRYLTSAPPGKVRFTIVDPVGLGENFAAFMHLADYHELLVNNRIWTETQHIEQRLADLQAHMEIVIQKYLRNEFETIDEYNAFAGEVAEPFRVLVVANFPTNFSESAARRLISIASTGARCGVYVLISLDTKQQLPTGSQLKDLEPHCVNLAWREGKLHWRDPLFGRFPLALDSPPEPERFTKLMHKIGALARDANRVEVPFEFIAPAPDRYWKSDSRAGIDVPLGRAGATKLQHLRLGKGTSQHVLIAGKTGSGKSTLLHALITNASLRYSPDEVELYLIDFKKGVEFKVYATMRLPHARVIAVESEREFGLSVLQRLDLELKARGDKFRDLGVQDLAGYRDSANGAAPLPRILLIVDEFQEFFVEDDKIAQEVALMLDRLVRQGRAFGIHVHLGSQSLGGAYSLARSTLGQMAVRIALQCSESDAHLILSEENPAARLLTRPGEAIYNDANGMVEGNNFFQVVWLSDERREDYLRTIRELARDRPPAAQIVFEGNLPAVPEKNHLLAGMMRSATWPEPPMVDVAWLGEAIAIKDPTSAVFRPQSGSNLLIVGQSDLMAFGMMTMAMISLAAQHDPAGARFEVFDGSAADSSLAGRLGRLRDALPHVVREVGVREVGAVLAELVAEVERRQRDEAGDAPSSIYLFIFDIQRFRDLRKADDDFGFSSSRYGDEKVTPPSKLFADILRDGPPLGVHTIVWCDSLNNLNRTFERSTLREFEMRVLFQMSANDSSTLIDSPAAGRLGPNRGLFFSEEEGRLEKFRPYGPPSEEWLAEVRHSFRSRPAPEPVVAEASDLS